MTRSLDPSLDARVGSRHRVLPGATAAPRWLAAGILAVGLIGVAGCNRADAPAAPNNPGTPPPMSTPSTGSGSAPAAPSANPQAQTPDGAAATLPSHEVAARNAPGQSAPTAGTAGTADDTSSTLPKDELTKAEESTAMPQAGHGNNHSKPAAPTQ